MEAIFFLIPLALLLALTGLGTFFWAVRDGQFEDLEGPRWRVLFDEEP
ncbi:MAG: cbb3-type cytochrome oxidase assembly protein CcoS [Candidatus Eremiobacterota bacterium]